MQITRRFTTKTLGPYCDIHFVERRSKITDKSGRVIHDLTVEAPEHWSQTAVDMLAQKYLRKAQVPSSTVPVGEEGVPVWLQRRVPAAGCTFGRETRADQVFHRVAAGWAYWGLKLGYFDSEDDAHSFYDEVCYMLAHQLMAPNSPQWFNCGLNHSYGINGDDRGLWAIDTDSGKVTRTLDTYSRPSVGACYISTISDSLQGKNSITDFMTREARIFSVGAGSGANYSELRGEEEPLSGGGKSSGLLSFLKPIDALAGSIKSGGTLRRAARMVVVDVDHPDIESFVDWKVGEEKKVAALVVGSAVVHKHVTAVYEAEIESRASAVADGLKAGVPYNLLLAAKIAAETGQPCPPVTKFDVNYEGEAYQTVTGQNANNSVRPTDAFMEAVRDDGPWNLYHRTELRKAKAERRTPVPSKTIRAKDLWRKIALAAWGCADPGLQFHDVMNDWNPVLGDGEIRATNPCSEFCFLDDSTCNLACLNLLRCLVYKPDKSVDWEKTGVRLTHAARLTTVALDITVSMASYPSASVAEGAVKYRTIGLGYANLGAVLMRNGIPYDSDAGRGWAACLTGVIHHTATETSAELARLLGTYPRFEDNKVHASKVVQNHCAFLTNEQYKDLKYPPPSPKAWLDAAPTELVYLAQSCAANAWFEFSKGGLRNAQLTLVMPAGTVGLLMDCDCTGCEPDFALVKDKQLAGGGWIKIVNQSVGPALEHLGYSPYDVKAITEYVYKKGTVENCDFLKPEHLPVFDCAVPCVSGGGKRSISPDGHMLMMAAIQPLVSGSISKTLNLDQNVSALEVERVHFRLWELRLKCGSLYRDGSKLSQPLNAGEVLLEKAEPVVTVVEDKPIRESEPRRRKLPGKRYGYTQKFKIPGGHKVYLKTGDHADGTLGEIFLTTHKDGSLMRSMIDAFSQAVSIGLQYGVPLREYVDAFTFTQFEPNGPVSGHDRIKSCTSVLDMVFRDLAINYLGRDDLAHVTPGVDPEAPKALPVAETAEVDVRYEGTPCPVCGKLRMVRNGTCLVCRNCGSTTGCA